MLTRNNISSQKALEKIEKSALNFLAPMNLEETYKTVVDEALKLTGASFGSILLRDSKNTLKRVYGSSDIAYTVKNRRRGNTYIAFTEKRVIIAKISELSKSHPQLAKEGVRCTVFIPLAYQNQAIGVLTLNLKKLHKFNVTALNALKIFGAFATLSIRKSQLYAEVKKSLEIRDLFIAIAAHEFRTPLTTISGYSQLLKKKISDTGASTEWLESILSETERLSDLVNNLLLVNKIQTGKFEYVWRECSFLEIVKREIDNFSFSYRRRKIEFKNETQEGEDRIIGDFDKLSSVIFDVLENAAKFSESTSVIEIKFFSKERYLCLAIKDHGVGIGKEHLKKIFDGFYKAPDTHTVGMGVGLFLAKNIIEKHGGKITINSREDHGTLIRIYLKKLNYA